MQRTVHGTKVIYGVLDRDENGSICIAEREYKSTEKDENKAKKSFRKSHPDDAILRTEPFTDLYMLDDDIFFKYAKVVTDTDENTATDTDENTATDDQ